MSIDKDICYIQSLCLRLIRSITIVGNELDASCMSKI